jgi:hypothetical protein
MDYLIIGAGPAGLQLGYFLERSGRDYLILEAGSHPGTFFRKYPRHRQLISINKTAYRHHGPRAEFADGLELAAERESGTALYPLLRALLSGCYRFGTLSGRLRLSFSPACSIRHLGEPDRPGRPLHDY